MCNALPLFLLIAYLSQVKELNGLTDDIGDVRSLGAAESLLKECLAEYRSVQYVNEFALQAVMFKA